jgi:hypothetical protein
MLGDAYHLKEPPLLYKESLSDYMLFSLDEVNA